jgi:hypothetical protein
MCGKSLDYWRHVEWIDLLKGQGTNGLPFVCPRDACRVGLAFQWNQSLNYPGISIGNNPGQATLWVIQVPTTTIPAILKITDIGLAITDLITVTTGDSDPDMKIFSLRYNPSNQ